MDEVRITVRLPRVVYEAVKARAEAERRSLNAQLVREVEEWSVSRQREWVEAVAWVEAQYETFRRLEGSRGRAVGLVEEFFAWLRGR